MEITKIYLSHLHGEEHLGYHTEVRQKLEAFNLEDIDIKPQMFADYSVAIETEDGSYKIMAKSHYTEPLSLLDTTRDQTVTGMVTQVRSLLTHFDPNIQQAADRVMIVFNAFGNMRKKNYVAETADIINFLQEINEGSIQEDIDLMNLRPWVDKLETDNNAFIRVYETRQEEQVKKDVLERFRICRINTDECYNAIVNRINAGIVFNGEERYKELVGGLNGIINYYNNILAQRKGRNAAKRGNETDDDLTES